MDRWMNGQRDGRIAGSMNKWVNAKTAGRISE